MLSFNRPLPPRFVFESGSLISVKDAAVAQELRLYGNTVGDKYISIKHDGSDGYLHSSAGALGFQVGGTLVSYYSTSFHFLRGADNLYDDGQNGANRSRNVYVGTAVIVGAAGGWSMSAAAASGLVANGNARLAHGTSALAVGATEGFYFEQSCAGTPTGTPATIPSGQIAAIINSVSGQLAIYAGAAWRALPRTTNVDTTAVGNVGAGTDDLITFSLPANTLDVNGKCVRVTARGTTANNANAKTLTMNFGSQTIVTQLMTASIAGQWEIQATIIRTGSNTQDIVCRLLQGATVIVTQTVTAGTQTDSGAIIIKCTGTATSDNDIVQENQIVEILN